MIGFWRRLRFRWMSVGIAALVWLGAPTIGLAAEEGENSLLALFIPERWRETLYSLRNWGQLDAIPNAIFGSVLTVLVLGLLARRLTFRPNTRSQNAVEWFVQLLNDTFGPVLGEHGRKYLPFVNSYFIVILVWNFLGLIPGMQAPTAELNTTVALAAVSLTAVQIVAIAELGLMGYLRHLWGSPLWLGILMFPIEVITQFARVLSLSLRLFANIYAKEIVFLVLYGLAVKIFFIPIHLPVIFIAILADLIQAFIFAILTAVYIAGFVEQHHEDHADELAAVASAHVRN